MSAQTSFRPQLHGFDFDNYWDLDDNYRNFVRAEVDDAVSIAAEAVATNPALGAALFAAIGAAYGVGEALLPGLFDVVAIPVIVDQIKNAVQDKIANGLPDHYGACGGMSFSSLDYYYANWAVPKGVDLHPLGKYTLTVPSLNFPASVQLRDYVFKRFADSWDSGGVLHEMLQWYIVLQTIPSALGGGGVEVQNRSKAEWQKLAGLLDQDKPQSIALLFDSWDIFDNHQVVAYGYGGDPFTGPAYINIYDNNHPDVEATIRFDFTGSEMYGAMVDQNGIVFPSTDSVGPEYAPLKGFFVANYVPQTPPFSWGVAQSIGVAPSACQSVGMDFELTDTAQNSFTFFTPFKQQTTKITPFIAPLLFSASNVPAPGPTDASSPDPVLVEATVAFKYTGTYLEVAKALLVVEDGNGAVAQDRFGQSLSALVSLPSMAVDSSSVTKLSVLAALVIEPVNRTGSNCYFPFQEGSTVSLQIAVDPFKGSNVRYAWRVPGRRLGNPASPVLELDDLPPAGSTLEVSVTEYNLDTGCIASGSMTVVTYTKDVAGRDAAVCRLAHYISQLRIPGPINPLGPDDPELTRYVSEHFAQIQRDGERLAALANAVGRMASE